MSTKLDKFDYDLVENYYMKNLIDNNFWLFGSFAGELARTRSTNSQMTAQEFLGRAIFGIQVEPKDISFMLASVVWRQGTTYVAFDNSVNLSEESFFVVVEPDIEGGDYHIFKCLSNSLNTPSLNKPIFINNISDGIYELADGYVWKYMSSTPFITYRRFFTRNLIPIVRNALVESVANDGIYSIIVENGESNRGYELITGIVESFDSLTSTIFINSPVKLESSSSSDLSPIQTFDFTTPNFYLNRTLYVRKNDSSSILESRAFNIIESGTLNSKPYVKVLSNTFIEANDVIQIAPTIEIKGDGTGAVAMPIFEGGKIVSTRMLEYGSNYTRAGAYIKTPVQAFDVNEGAIVATIRPIISPRGGHGTNIFRELKSKHIGIAKSISSGAGSSIPSSGTYSKIGLVKSPLFDGAFDATTFDNRLKMFLGSSVGALSVGDVVTQGDVEGTVHEVDSAESTIYVSNYVGPYTEIFVNTQPISVETGGIDINTIEYSPYISDSGDVLFISDSTPITRSQDKIEQLRLIIDF